MQENKRIWILFGFAFVAGFFYFRSHPESLPAPARSANVSARASAPLGSSPSARTVPHAAPNPPWTFERREAALMQAHGQELFEALYSAEFRREWRSHLPALEGRLSGSWPAPGTSHADTAKAEGVARLGILKALGEVEVAGPADANALKQFLLGYLDSRMPRPWTLEREALHALARPGLSLSEAEIGRALARSDVRARGLAGRSDQDILREVIEGAAHD